MICYAVIDTNVLVAALLTKNPMSPTIEVFNAIKDGRIIPLYHQEIISEYNDVLRRTKFHFPAKDIDTVIGYVVQNGIDSIQIKRNITNVTSESRAAESRD